MKERSAASEVRQSVPSNMIPVFDLIAGAYKKHRVVPDFRGCMDDKGEIQALFFDDVPQDVMSLVFDKIEKIKGTETCGYALEAQISSNEDVFHFSIRITKDKFPEINP